MQKCIFVQFSAPNRGFATGMAILRASNVNHRGITCPNFAVHQRQFLLNIPQAAAPYCWRKMLTENYKTSEGKQHDGRLKSTEMMKENSTTANRNLQKG